MTNYEQMSEKAFPYLGEPRKPNCPYCADSGKIPPFGHLELDIEKKPYRIGGKPCCHCNTTQYTQEQLQEIYGNDRVGDFLCGVWNRYNYFMSDSRLENYYSRQDYQIRKRYERKEWDVRQWAIDFVMHEKHGKTWSEEEGDWV